MAKASVIGKGLPTASPPPQPHGVDNEPSGGRGGDSGGQAWDQLDLYEKTTLSYIEDVHVATQEMVRVLDESGRGDGISKLAELMGKNHGEIGQRLRREVNSKGEIMRGNFDMVGHAAAAEKRGAAARKCFLDTLGKRWGFKPAEPINVPPPQVQVQMLLRGLAKAGSAGAAILKDAAESEGFDVSIFKRR